MKSSGPMAGPFSRPRHLYYLHTHNTGETPAWQSQVCTSILART